MVTRPTFDPTGKPTDVPGAGAVQPSQAPLPSRYFSFFLGQSPGGASGRVWEAGEQYIQEAANRQATPEAADPTYFALEPFPATFNMSQVGLDPEEEVLFYRENFVGGVSPQTMTIVVPSVPEGDYVLTYITREGFGGNFAPGRRVYEWLEVNGLQFAAGLDLWSASVGLYGIGDAPVRITSPIFTVDNTLLVTVRLRIDASSVDFAPNINTMFWEQASTAPATPQDFTVSPIDDSTVDICVRAP